MNIGAVAGRTGLPAKTIRYYEEAGLVAPAARADNGYRVYDERALERLAFIAHAKQLGCSLEEITDLVAIWDGDECAPVQRRFHELPAPSRAQVEATLSRHGCLETLGTWGAMPQPSTVRRDAVMVPPC